MGCLLVVKARNNAMGAFAGVGVPVSCDYVYICVCVCIYLCVFVYVCTCICVCVCESRLSTSPHNLAPSQIMVMSYPGNCSSSCYFYILGPCLSPEVFGHYSC